MKRRWTDILALTFLAVVWAWCAYQVVRALVYRDVYEPRHRAHISFAEAPVEASIILGMSALGLLIFSVVLYVAWSGQRDFIRWASRNRQPTDIAIKGPAIAGSAREPGDRDGAG